MFDRISGVYDLMNSAMTAGLHHRWRQRAVDRAQVGPGSDALDLCCGTGDLALELRRRIGPDGRVVGSDFSEPMLELARAEGGRAGAFRSSSAGPTRSIFPMATPASTRSRSASAPATSPTSTRGCARWRGCCGPAAGWRSSRSPAPRGSRWRASTRSGSTRSCRCSAPLAGDPDAYSYLPESVRTFPEPRALAAMMEAAGFEQIRWLLTAGGIIAIHSATGRRGSRSIDLGSTPRHRGDGCRQRLAAGPDGRGRGPALRRLAAGHGRAARRRGRGDPDGRGQAPAPTAGADVRGPGRGRSRRPPPPRSS